MLACEQRKWFCHFRFVWFQCAVQLWVINKREHEVMGTVSFKKEHFSIEYSLLLLPNTIPPF